MIRKTGDFLILIIVISLASFTITDNSLSKEYIRKHVERLIIGMDAIVGDQLIYCKKIIPQFYLRREFKPAWSNVDRNELLEILSDAEAEGLRATDYHYDAIKNFKNKNLSGIEKAELDMLLSDAFLLYASHFLNGKVNPETVDSEWKAIRREGNALEFLENALKKSHIKEDLTSLEPSHISYQGLKKSLYNFKKIKASGGWKIIPHGETLKINSIDSMRVPLLIKRLTASRDLEIKPVNPFIYSENISEALKSFQSRHGLDQDGNLGKATTSALNISIDLRVEQIQINMERYRWITQELGTHFVLTNIADYSLEVYKGNEQTYKEIVIVGKPFRKTPVFSSKMTYIVVNPTWTVPPTILINDILPEVKKNPDYLKTKNIKIIKGQGSSATIIDAKSVDWSKMSKDYFPYTLRQDPGPNNALGLVKFMFPNSYNVYIHDTPSKELFSQTDRAFSSGCIRIKNPIKFAEYLLKDETNWNENKLQAVLKAGIEKSIVLSKPVNVHILYLTAWSKNGKIHFRNDLYERDQPVLAALKASPPSL